MKFELSRLQGGQSLTARLSFRSKLLLVLFVPFLALVVVAAAGLSDRFSALHAQEQYGNLSGPYRTLDDASRALQNESVVSSWFVASGGAPASQLDQARDRTDAAVREFRANEAAFAEAGLSPAALAALDETNKGFDGIPDARKQVDARSASASTTRDFFLGVDEHLLDFGERVAGDLSSGDVAASLTRVFSLQRTQHELAREASIYIAVLASGTPQDFTEWVGAQAAQAQELASFSNTANGPELAAFASVKGAQRADTDLPASFPPAGQTPGEYYVDYTQESRTLDKAIDAVTGVINSAASALASDALSDVRIYGGLAAFAMLLTLLLIWFVSRAVVRPVRELTAAAREMSQRQLPALVESLRTGGDVSAIQPVRIEVKSEDEIGDLAQAFNDVEAVTLEVAQEQSRLLRKGMGDLFVNLARRNQSLVQRQLELLDDLERNEHDPAALDALFKLDHMATRMRRNAESLLVLSGAEQPRQWQQPIALIDVVRAAAAEIADFPRVELVGIDDDLAVSGRAVSDVAHLLAELLENATSFSPPDSAVVVSGAVSATGFVLAVSDQGIGMPPERIAEANKLLAQPPLVGLALSRALGLHVVGSLAARHGISVELRPGAPGGLVALVALPTSVLEPRAVKAPPAPTPPLYTSPVVDDESVPPLGARREVTRPPDEPPVEEWRREGLADVESSAPAAPTYDVPPTVDVPPAPAFDATATYEAPPTYDAPAPPPFVPPVVDETPVVEEPLAAPIEDAPLPTRVPGQHLSHHPLISGEVAEVDDDPMRPYRVHELLTRHAQGKRRGQMGESAPESAPSADIPSGAPQETPVPGAPGLGQENGT